MLLSNAIRKRTARQAPAAPQRAAPAAPVVPVLPPPPAQRAPVERFVRLGIDDEVVVCEKCGKTDLRCTVVLGVIDADGNIGSEVRYGRDCALRALGRRVTPAATKKIEQEARAYERDQLMARRASSQRVVVDEGRFGKTYATVYRLDGGGFFAQVPDADLHPARVKVLGGEWKPLGMNWFVRR